MYVIREIMYCKPGKVGEMIKRFKAMEPLMKEAGQSAPKVMTDVTGEQFWTLVWEQETPNFDQYMKEMQEATKDPRFQKIMEGYHDCVLSGKREIYKLE
jgi:hypothetical protein